MKMNKMMKTKIIWKQNKKKINRIWNEIETK